MAQLVWDMFGDTDSYCEPFAGSSAIFLARPHPGRAETLNDSSGFIVNVWRAIRADPDTVAALCDDWVCETDLFARHVALVQAGPTLTERLMADPRYFDAELAAWWVWGASSWIGSGWCNGDGPWTVEDGRVVKRAGRGVARKMPIVSATGSGNLNNSGIHSAKHRGVRAKMPRVGADGGASDGYSGIHSARLRGVAKQMPGVSADASGGYIANGVHGSGLRSNLPAYFARLAARLRDVRILCGDWSRVLSPRITTAFGVCGVFLDPPYPGTHTAFYEHGDTEPWHAAQAWAIEHGDDPAYRIVLCGMDDQTMPDTWRMMRWSRAGGYGSQGNGAGRANASREVLWFNRWCGGVNDLPLFAQEDRL